MPASIEYNPPEATLEYFTRRRRPVVWAPPELRYPFNMQVLHYPQLGLSVVLVGSGPPPVLQAPDRGILRRRSAPRSRAARRHALTCRWHSTAGAACFGRSRRGSRRCRRGRTWRASRRPTARVCSAHLVAPGAPADSLWGSGWCWTHRDTRSCATRAGCRRRPAAPPRRKSSSSRPRSRPASTARRPVGRQHARAPRARPLRHPVGDAGVGLAISDLVLLCGSDPTMQTGNTVRIEPSFDRRVAANQPLCRVASRSIGWRPLPTAAVVSPTPISCALCRRTSASHRNERRSLEASREEQNIGPLRRRVRERAGPNSSPATTSWTSGARSGRRRRGGAHAAVHEAGLATSSTPAGMIARSWDRP